MRGNKKKTQVWGPPCEFGRRLHGLLDLFASVRLTVKTVLGIGPGAITECTSDQMHVMLWASYIQ